jgi:hypothetical protein
MKKIIFILFAAFFTLGFTGCKNYDSDIDNLNARVTALEEWQQSVNLNITSLKGIVEALQKVDYVTGVVALTDGTGYQITFKNSGTITIKNGTDGTTPVMGVDKYSDGYYYWTVNTGSGVTWLKDANGKMVRTTGDTPKMKIGEDGYWYVAADGVNFVSTGVKAQGDAVFAKDGVKVDEYSITFTLADGTTTFTVPRYQTFKIGSDENNDAMLLTPTVPDTIALQLGSALSKYTAIMAQVKVANSTTSITSRAASDSIWNVQIVKPTFTNDQYNADGKIILTAPKKLQSTSTLLLEVTLINQDGSKVTANRPLVAGYKVGDLYPNKVAPVGFVVWVNEKDTTYNATFQSSLDGKIMSIEQTEHMDATNALYTAYDYIYCRDWDDGYKNLQTILTWISKNSGKSIDNFPAIKWCMKFGNGWYLPAVNEIGYLYKNKELLNKAIAAYSATAPVLFGYMRTSTETVSDNSSGYSYNLETGEAEYDNKTLTDSRLRAFYHF